MSTSQQSQKQPCKAAPPPIVALPSMSSHLFSLPHAHSLASLHVHPALSPQRQAESEAKLMKALERNIARQNAQPPSHHTPRPPLPPPPSSSKSHQSSPIMMRTRKKPPFQS